LRNLLHLLMALATAVVLGFGLSYVSLENGLLLGAVRLGPWVAWPDEGSPNPDPYTRAHIARDGALQLARAEGVSFVAQRDSEGSRLDLDCTYRLDGIRPSAAFWTLTATDENGRLVTASGAGRAINSTRIAREDDGSSVLRVGSQLAPGNWLETQGSGPFQLVLRVYDSSILSGFSTFEGTLPSVVPERCA